VVSAIKWRGAPRSNDLPHGAVRTIHRGIPNKESSIAKLYSSELDVRLASTAMHISGMHSQIVDRDDDYVAGGKFARFYMHSTTSPIGGGRRRHV